MYSNSQNSIISFDCSWFFAKIFSNFVSLPWKLHNRYCHNGHTHTRTNRTHLSGCIHSIPSESPTLMSSHQAETYFESARKQKLASWAHIRFRITVLYQNVNLPKDCTVASKILQFFRRLDSEKICFYYFIIVHKIGI